MHVAWKADWVEPFYYTQMLCYLLVFLFEISEWYNFIGHCWTVPLNHKIIITQLNHQRMYCDNLNYVLTV